MAQNNRHMPIHMVWPDISIVERTEVASFVAKRSLSLDQVRSVERLATVLVGGKAKAGLSAHDGRP